MLQPDQVAEIAREIAVANLTSREIASVLTEPTVDSQGKEVLRITIVVEPGAERRFAPEAVCSFLPADQPTAARRAAPRRSGFRSRPQG